jgi:hypothetical protein
LRNLFSSLGWHLKAIQYLLPLYDYFMLVRNCIVHRSGRASQTLVEIGKSKLLADCIASWPSKRGKKIPDLPELQVGTEIPLFPRHAILFSEVCHRAATQINVLLSGFLGIKGTVYTAAYYGLFAEDRIQVNDNKSPEQVVNSILRRRWSVVVPHNHEAIRVLKGLDIWTDCREKFSKLSAQHCAP